MDGQWDRACRAPRVGVHLGQGWGLGGQAGPSPGWAGSLTSSVLVPDSGRLPWASVVSLSGARRRLICGGLAGLTWTVVCRWQSPLGSGSPPWAWLT